MRNIKSLYRELYEQCFVPIFVRDNLDTELLLEGCKLAGVKFIEYTLRRTDAKDIIPTLKSRHPEFCFTVGSTLDSETIVKKLSGKNPQLMTFEEINEAGADGFVSMLAMSDETLKKYSDDHIMIPGADNAWDALRQINAGAHFIKILGSRMDLVRSVNAAPAFNFCPVFVTGGVRPATMRDVYGAGAVLTAAGFDVILKDIEASSLTAELVGEKVKLFVDEAKKARSEAFPELANLSKLSDDEFFAVLPNYSRF